jgi:hypothetical protein
MTRVDTQQQTNVSDGKHIIMAIADDTEIIITVDIASDLLVVVSSSTTIGKDHCQSQYLHDDESVELVKMRVSMRMMTDFEWLCETHR